MKQSASDVFEICHLKVDHCGQRGIQRYVAIKYLVPDLCATTNPESAVMWEMCRVGVEILEETITKIVLDTWYLVRRNVVQRELDVGLCRVSIYTRAGSRT